MGTSLDLIKEFGCDDIVLRQICQQLVYYVVSISLNQLLGKCQTNILKASLNINYFYSTTGLV